MKTTYSHYDVLSICHNGGDSDWDKNFPQRLYSLVYSDDHAAKSLIKFQKILNIPAVQLVNKSGICKLVSGNNLKTMIISADHWLSLLP